MPKHLITIAALFLLTASAKSQMPPDDLQIIDIDSMLIPGDSMSFAETLPYLVSDSILMPSYPVTALNEGMDGKIVVQVLIKRDGTIGTVHVAQEIPKGYGFGEAVQAAVKEWHYFPAIRASEVVDFWIGLRFKFLSRLDSSSHVVSAEAGTKIAAPRDKLGPGIETFVISKLQSR